MMTSPIINVIESKLDLADVFNEENKKSLDSIDVFVKLATDTYKLYKREANYNQIK